jgi:serine/threonine-protein kinase
MNALQLKLLGGASIETERGPLSGPAAQRRRLALLARLALAGDTGVSRDKLVAYLWPEGGTAGSRHLLSDSIYRINQAVGGEAIVAVGEALRLDPAVLGCDVVAFEEALARDEPVEAVRRYAGPFLDGFFIEGALEFERWAAEERDRLARAWVGAVEALAGDAESSGDLRGAADLWRRLAVHDPYSSRIAVRLVQTLAAAGDPAAALRQARVHEALLKSEINAAPPPEFARAVAALRSAPAAAVPVASAVPVAPAAAAPPVAPAAPAPRPLRRAAWLVALAAGLGVGVWGLLSLGSTPGATAVAVLPFTDISPDHDQAYFADGITEELINTLSRVEGLRVPSRTSVFALRDVALDVRDVGQRLGVESVLEGSVRRAGNQLRITAQLVSTRDGYHLWSGTYDRELADVFAIQEEIARAIVATLQVELGGGARDPLAERPTTDPEAYGRYLRGRYHWHRRSEEGLRAAAADFAEAVRLAPDYGRAWAGLADAYAVLGFYDYLPPTTAFPEARTAALRAYEAEETRGEAAATLGYVSLYFDWDWPVAEDWFRRSIALEPQSSKAHQWYANFLTARGRFDEAEREMRRAQELEPLSLIASAALGWVFFHARRYADALRQLDATLALDSGFVLAHLWRGQVYELLGRPDSAAASLRRAVALSHDGTLAVGALALALGRAGATRDAAALYEQLVSRRATGYQPAYEIAKAALGLGRRDEALGWLETALADRSHSLAFLDVDPQLDPLRDDPRFAQLRRRSNH